MRRIKFILLLFFSFYTHAEAQNRVGMVVGITGTARLADATGNERQLTARNFAVSLSIGQTLKADGKSKVRIKLCNGKAETIGSKVYHVPQVICSNTSSPQQLSVFEKVFAPGGRRGGDEFILFPTEQDLTTIRPETALFRWKSTAGKLTISIAIASQSQPIWQHEVEGSTAMFSSDELHTVLAELRHKQPNVRLRLRLSSLAIDKTADFVIFSLEDEDDMKKQLAETNREQGILRHLACASVYSRYGLQNELAKEFEQALKLSPESMELIMATASAQESAGNVMRSDELDEQWRILKK